MLCFSPQFLGESKFNILIEECNNILKKKVFFLTLQPKYPPEEAV